MSLENLKLRDMYRVLRQVPSVVRAQMRRENVVLAGGIIRDTVAGLPVKDIDLFCHSGEQAERLALEASTYVKHTTFAYTAEGFPLPVQYVFYKDYKDAPDLISQFDFRACCAGIFYDQAARMFQGVSVEGFNADCRDRVLRFMSQEKDKEKLTALRRALDFSTKGWTISNDEVTNILVHFEPTFKPDRVRLSFRPCYGRY
jgi:hypothetical protein